MKMLGFVILFLGLWPAVGFAHQTGQSTFVVHIKPESRQVDTMLACPAADVAHAAEVSPGPDDVLDLRDAVAAWPQLGFYLDPRISVSNDGRLCNAIEHRLSPSTEPGAFWFLKAFECDGPLGEVVVKNDAMTETVGGYRHLGRIQLGEVVHPTIFTAATPTFTLRVPPSTAEAPTASLGETIARFLREGFVHILIGWDHVLFVLALVLMSRKLRELLVVVTAFTVAHSVTLALAALDVVKVSASVVEPIIALSIAWVALEAVLERDETPRRAYLATFLLGLVHGFGFSYVLRDDVGLPMDALVPALFSFNAGVEFGQLAIVLVLYPVRAWIRDKPWEKRAVGITAGLIGALALYWFVERVWG